MPPAGPKSPQYEVGKDICTKEGGGLRTPINEPSDHGFSIGPRELVDSRHDSLVVAFLDLWRETSGAFQSWPSIVASLYDEVHLLDSAISNVTQEEPPRPPVEAHAERVAKAVGPDLWEGAFLPYKWIVERNAVRSVFGIDIDAQDLPQEAAQVLSLVADFSARRAAVPRRDVEHPIGSESEVSRLVNDSWLSNHHDDSLGGRR